MEFPLVELHIQKNLTKKLEANSKAEQSLKFETGADHIFRIILPHIILLHACQNNERQKDEAYGLGF